MARRRLIVFAREPVPGEVKTRLCPPYSSEAAARLARAFLQDTVETFAPVPGLQVSVHYTPPGSGHAFRRLLGEAMTPWLAPQSPGHLGARLLSAFAGACPAWWPVVIIGSDSPDLPPALVEHAFQVLESDAADVAIGPALDGGITLVGARQPHPHLFHEVPWSTPAVLAAVMQRAEEARLRAALLPAWEDVDTAEDLERLRDRLQTAEPTVAPRTRAVLRALGRRRTD